MELADFFKTCSIIFTPVCQHCGAVINSPVEIIQSTELLNADTDRSLLDKTKSCVITNYKIEPGKCPNCGFAFTSIVGPGNLYDHPYDVLDMFDEELVKGE